MVQTQSPTTEGYGEIGKHMAGEAATPVKSVTGIMTSCTASEAQTASGITKATNGLGLVNADTVASAKITVINDTVQVDHKFTASGSVTVKGFGILNDDDDVLFMICCFNADIPMENGDTLTVQGKLQFKLGS